ncbi:MAG: hypothetical protein H7X76_02255 [Prolixibacteraceae bacterium]|nr:hypothetical protein [Burkholderiales bacterium]
MDSRHAEVKSRTRREAMHGIAPRIMGPPITRARRDRAHPCLVCKPAK